ncbi:MAG: hypothetical protein ACR2RF_18175 [Geminicoccaceae bacterium]
MKLTARVVVIVGLAFLVAILLSNREDRTKNTFVSADRSDDIIRKCYERGIAYFKEIGSYPTLSDGRLAGDVAAERCGRSRHAF